MIRGRRSLLWQALAVSMALHACAVWWLRQMPGAPFHMSVPLPLEIRVLPPKQVPMPHAPQTEPATKHTHTENRSVNRDKEPPPPAATATSSADQATPVQSPGARSLDLSESARRSAGMVDRELRQSGAAQAGREAQPGRAATALERGISAAGLPRGMVLQEVTGPGGRLMTKVITSSGVYCVWGRRPGASMTENELAALTTTTCP